MAMVAKQVPKVGSDEAFRVVEAARDSGKLRKGVNESTKAIERGIAKLVVIAEDVTPPEVVAHLPVLCQEKSVPFVFVPAQKDLGIAAGIGVKASSIAITDAGTGKELLESFVRKITDSGKK